MSANIYAKTALVSSIECVDWLEYKSLGEKEGKYVLKINWLYRIYNNKDY
jgi:hypothetical protein